MSKKYFSPVITYSHSDNFFIAEFLAVSIEEEFATQFIRFSAVSSVGLRGLILSEVFS